MKISSLCEQKIISTQVSFCNLQSSNENRGLIQTVCGFEKNEQKLSAA